VTHHGYDGVMQNIWKSIKLPCVVLAPMADVTDAAFRAIITKYGKPDVFWTEFVSADGLYQTREIQKMKDEENPLMKDLYFDESQRPIVAQIFSAKPEMIEYASRLVTELGFDGVDINMGCPHRVVEKQGAGAALIKKPELARKLIQSAKRGTEGKIAVSIKTRIGYNKNELKTWLPHILAEKPNLVTIHARTRKELSEVPARWEHVKEAVEIRNILYPQKDVLIFGNGDVTNLKEARKKIRETKADGVMIGRGIFGNPWLFSEKKPSFEEKLQTLTEHCYLFEKLCSHKNFAVMKKHFKAYVTGFEKAKEMRIALFECNNAQEVEKVIKKTIRLSACKVEPS